MQYNSWLYLIFFLAPCVGLYYLLPLQRRWIILLAASLVFYFVTCRQWIVIPLATTLVLYLAGLALEHAQTVYKSQKAGADRDRRRALKAVWNRQNHRIIAITCILVIGTLFFTKYYNFIAENINRLLGALGLQGRLSSLHLFLPLGISFYTLSAVSYVCDIARGDCAAQKNFGKLATFLLFFPVITEGPICRYGQLGVQLEQGHRFDYQKFCFGLQRIIWGLFLKVVLADRLNRFAGGIFDHPGQYQGIVIALGILLYTLQIYLDFSGCIDIARGSAALFGITLPENFRRPFFAVSVSDFWRRWHITLGAWLRDYIFYPLSMSGPLQTLSRHSRRHLSAYYAATLPAILALLAVWTANGIWHGSAWKYLVYGLYYYALTALGMLFEPFFVRLLDRLHLQRSQPGYHLWQILRTFLLVNLGMLLFRAPSVSAAWTLLQNLFRPGTESVGAVLSRYGLPPEQLTIILCGLAIVFTVSVLQERGIGISSWIAARPLPLRWSLYLAALLLVIIAGAYGAGFGAVDFIYAQF